MQQNIWAVFCSLEMEGDCLTQRRKEEDAFSTLSWTTKLEKVPHFCAKYSRGWKCWPVISPDAICVLISWHLSFWGCKCHQAARHYCLSTFDITVCILWQQSRQTFFVGQFTFQVSIYHGLTSFVITFTDCLTVACFTAIEQQSVFLALCEPVWPSGKVFCW